MRKLMLLPAALAAALAAAAPAVAIDTFPRVEPRPGLVAVEASTSHIGGVNAGTVFGAGSGALEESWSDQRPGTGSAVSSYRWTPPGSWPFFPALPPNIGFLDGATWHRWNAGAHASIDLASGELNAYAMSAMTVSGLTGQPHQKFGSNDNRAGLRVWDTLTLSEPATITLAGSVEGRFRFLDTLDLTPFPASLDLDIAFHRDNPDFEEGGGEGGPVPLIYEGGVGRFYEAPVTAGSPIEIDEDYSVQVSLPAGTHYFTLELSVETGSDTYGNNGIWHSVATEADFADTLSFRIEVPDGVAISSGSGLLPIVGGETSDETPPAISCDDAPAGWQGENVTIACTAGDAASGLADPADASFSLATTVPAGVEIADATTREREVCDSAGNCATAGPIGGLQVDRKAPEITFGAISPAANASGWHNGDVSIAFTAVDGGSGVASTAPAASPLLLTGEGAAVSAAVTATDAVGNVASAVSPAAAIDRTAPTIAFSGNAGSYEVDEDVTISCSASDALSGLASDTCGGVSGPAYSFGVGTSSLSATATDLAGNVGSASTTFEVTVSSVALGSLVERFVENAGVEHALVTKLEKGHVKPFVHQVEALAGEKLSREHADVLVRLAQALSSEEDR